MDCVRVQVVREYHSICLPLLLGCYRMLCPLWSSQWSNTVWRFAHLPNGSWSRFHWHHHPMLPRSCISEERKRWWQ